METLTLTLTLSNPTLVKGEKYLSLSPFLSLFLSLSLSLFPYRAQNSPSLLVYSEHFIHLKTTQFHRAKLS